MGPVRFVYVAGAAAFFAACSSGSAASSPQDASIDAFCEAKSWLVVEGTDRFFESGLPSQDELVELVHDWGEELARTGTPDNMSEQARAGFEKLVDRIEGLEAGDVDSGAFNWDDGAWEGDEEQSFANYVTNTCP